MYIFEVLYKEHENIHAFTDKLEQMAIDFMEKNEISFEAYEEAIDFIKMYADKCHHQKEEQVLFKAMLENLGEMANNLINHGMIVEHNLARLYVWELEEALKAYKQTPTTVLKLKILTTTMSYVYLLRRHIHKENNAVYPYAKKNLPKDLIEKLDLEAKKYDGVL